MRQEPDFLFIYINTLADKRTQMTTLYYRSLRKLEPRPGVNYATVYVRQTPTEYEHTRTWIQNTAQAIVAAVDSDAELAEWFTRPQKSFRTSQPGRYYTPAQLITDLLNQVSLERDLTQAMIDRWNRLCHDTPWHIELVCGTRPVVPHTIWQ